MGQEGPGRGGPAGAEREAAARPGGGSPGENHAGGSPRAGRVSGGDAETTAGPRGRGARGTGRSGRCAPLGAGRAVPGLGAFPLGVAPPWPAWGCKCPSAGERVSLHPQLVDGGARTSCVLRPLRRSCLGLAALCPCPRGLEPAGTPRPLQSCGPREQEPSVPWEAGPSRADLSSLTRPRGGGAGS